MSYSGFKTLSNEAFYDKLVFKLLQLLSYKALNSDYAPTAPEYEKIVWVKKIIKIWHALQKMEQASETLTLMSQAIDALCQNL